MKFISAFVFAMGIVLAIAAGAKVPAVGETYPSTVAQFIVGIVFAIGGSIAWHYRIKKDIHAELDEHRKSGTSPADYLHKALDQAKKLQSEISGLNVTQICEKTDEILVNSIAPFVEFKQTLLNMYGMSDGADILVKIAFGERMLNRVWSAASDQHIPEATSSLDEAVMAIESAVKHIDELKV